MALDRQQPKTTSNIDKVVRAVFFDRDGVLVKSVRRPTKTASTPPWSWEEFEFLPYAKTSTLITEAAGLLNLIFTNQPDVKDGLCTQELVDRINSHVSDVCHIHDTAVCYDRTSDNYKPSPGMIFDLQKKHNIDLTKSYVVGDRWRDIVAGHAAGTFNILIDDGNAYLEWPDKYKHIKPDYTCSNVFEACKFILAHS